MIIVLVVTITVFRLMIVVKPLYSQVYCSSRNEKRALIMIFICSILSILPYYYYQTNIIAQNILKMISAIVSLLVPWLICLILWIILIRIVNREIGTKNSHQFILHSEVIAQRLKSKSKITRMVMIICFFNIICQLPVLILTVVGLINGNPCGHLSVIIFVGLLFISNILLIVNHAVHFFIYSLTNCKFRYTLKIMSCRCIFSYQRRATHRATLAHFDEHRQTPYHGRIEGNLSSHSKSHLTPHLPLRIHLKDRTHYRCHPPARAFL